MSGDAPDAELDELRRRIDALDTALLELLAQRVEVVLEVAAFKRRRGLRVYDPARERTVLARLSALGRAPLTDGIVRHVFERIIDECRRLEQWRVELGHPGAPPSGPLPTPPATRRAGS